MQRLAIIIITFLILISVANADDPSVFTDGVLMTKDDQGYILSNGYTMTRVAWTEDYTIDYGCGEQFNRLPWSEDYVHVKCDGDTDEYIRQPNSEDRYCADLDYYMVKQADSENFVIYDASPESPDVPGDQFFVDSDGDYFLDSEGNNLRGATP